MGAKGANQKTQKLDKWGGKARSMRHWNNNIMVVMDTETTGLDPFRHEIWNFAAVALDANVEPMSGVMPFEIKMAPANPELIDWDVDVMKRNRSKILEAIRIGFDQDKAKDLFLDWIEKLEIPLNASGYNRCKILPLGHNYAFDKGFIQQWLGSMCYEENFYYHYRDSMNAAAYVNDRAAFHGEPVPYSKISLEYMCNIFKIEHQHAHDALNDAINTAKVYKAICQQGLF